MHHLAKNLASALAYTQIKGGKVADNSTFVIFALKRLSLLADV
jgi:hypothetical protein